MGVLLLPNKNEEVNLVTDLLKLLTLKYVSRYPSIDFKEAYTVFKEVINEFKIRMERLKKKSFCLDVDSLKEKQLFKDKYYIHGAFLATISSYPILYKIANRENIKSAVFAKTAMATSCKILDNINDSVHSFEEAVNSQENYYRALTSGWFKFNGENLKWVKKAENSAYEVASWTYKTIVSNCGKPEVMFNVYVSDVEECVKGQLESFYQMKEKYVYNNLTLAEYSQRISAKGIGKMWVDIDLCFYEKFLGRKISQKELKAVRSIRKSLDLLFRSLLFYDDVTDLEEDIENGIVNSTVMLGLETGKISLNDVTLETGNLIRKLKEGKVTEDIIKVGDIFYLVGIEYLNQIKKYSRLIDADALIFCARVLRLFLLRKLLKKGIDLTSLKIFFQSLLPFEWIKASIPNHLTQYYRIALDIAENSDTQFTNNKPIFS